MNGMSGSGSTGRRSESPTPPPPKTRRQTRPNQRHFGNRNRILPRLTYNGSELGLDNSLPKYVHKGARLYPNFEENEMTPERLTQEF